MIKSIAAGLVMVSVLVVIHELGHWLVARLFKVGTPVFSIGMGPRIAGFRWLDTDFRISALPVGGYVQMSGADPFGEEDADAWVDPEADFMRKPVWQRLLIMLAGPAMNLALPFVVFTAVLMAGQPQLDRSIGRVVPGSAADAAGLRPHDVIVKVEGQPVTIWSDVSTLLSSADATIDIEALRGDQPVVAQLPRSELVLDPDGIADVNSIGLSHYPHGSRVGVSDRSSPAWKGGLRPADGVVSVDGQAVDTFQGVLDRLGEGGSHVVVVKRIDDDDTVSEHELTLVSDGGPWGIEPLETYIGFVDGGSAAEEAGVKVGDKIVAIDGTPILAWGHVIDLVGRTTEGMTSDDDEPRPLVLELIRDGEPLSLTFAPRVTRQLIRGEPTYRPVMGVIQFRDAYATGGTVVKHFGPVEAFERASEECWLILRSSFRMLGNLVTGSTRVNETLGGPVAIFHAAGLAADAGLFAFAKMMGTISFSLGIINLLPVPVLDGGQIVFYVIEGLRGRPLPLVIRERILMVGVLAIAALMLYLTVGEVGRLVSG
jgi:regulator of sigma E protease